MVQRIALTFFALALASACGNNTDAPTTADPAKAPTATTPAATASPPAANAVETLTVAQLSKDIGAFEGKTIRLQGLVSHVCRRSGKKLFLVGVEEGRNFKIVPADGFTTYEMSLEGTEVVAEGTLVSTGPQNDARHNGHAPGENCATKQIEGYVLESVSVTPIP